MVKWGQWASCSTAFSLLLLVPAILDLFLNTVNKLFLGNSFLKNLWNCTFFSPMRFCSLSSFQFSSVQSLSCVRLFVTPWITAHQASLSVTISRSSLRLTSIKSMMPSSHLILCRPFILLPPIPPSIRVFSNESTLLMRWPKYWSFSFSIIPSKGIPWHHHNGIKQRGTIEPLDEGGKGERKAGLRLNIQKMKIMASLHGK